MNGSDKENSKPPAGTVGWIDLTTNHADQLREFYDSVVGWNSAPVQVDGYEDFVIHPAGVDEPVAGICHRKGPNSDAPSGWLMYIHVDDLSHSLANVQRLGGKKIGEVRDLGSYGRSCAVEDPHGSRCVLIQRLDGA